MQPKQIRNIAIIAHVDHGKTTIVDQLLRQSDTLDKRKGISNRVMDSDVLEQERGITIIAKNTAISWRNTRINIIDTPGHADFGGEVERILRIADSALLLVDAVEGPMPQTRFVTQKALTLGLKLIVVVNKIDRDGARPDWVIDMTFDLFDELGATDEQLDFPVIYTSALNGYSSLSAADRSGDMTPLLTTIVERVEPPRVDAAGALQLQVVSLAYDQYKGVIGTGRIQRGTLQVPTIVTILDKEGNQRSARISEAFTFNGLERIPIESTCAGDIVAFCGPEHLHISDTLCDPSVTEVLAAIEVEQPTVGMTLRINDSPFAGQSGNLLTSRQIRDRLQKELLHNVALRVEEVEQSDVFHIAGRGELHLSILIENMRREGFELNISKPKVLYKEVDGTLKEPYERMSVDLPHELQGVVIEALSKRKAILQNLTTDEHGRVRLDFVIPSRGLIGFRTRLLSITQGKGSLHSTVSHYGDVVQQAIGNRKNGVLVSAHQGQTSGYALFNLQERGQLFVSPGEMVYEGMIIGIHSRDNDLVVNPLKSKQLTNIRAAGSDENILLTPPLKLTLEQALDFINEDELVEITPDAIRIRKRYLQERERKRKHKLLR